MNKSKYYINKIVNTYPDNFKKAKGSHRLIVNNSDNKDILTLYNDSISLIKTIFNNIKCFYPKEPIDNFKGKESSIYPSILFDNKSYIKLLINFGNKRINIEVREYLTFIPILLNNIIVLDKNNFKSNLKLIKNIIIQTDYYNDIKIKILKYINELSKEEKYTLKTFKHLNNALSIGNKLLLNYKNKFKIFKPIPPNTYKEIRKIINKKIKKEQKLNIDKWNPGDIYILISNKSFDILLKEIKELSNINEINNYFNNNILSISLKSEQSQGGKCNIKNKIKYNNINEFTSDKFKNINILKNKSLLKDKLHNALYQLSDSQNINNLINSGFSLGYNPNFIKIIGKNNGNYNDVKISEFKSFEKIKIINKPIEILSQTDRTIFIKVYLNYKNNIVPIKVRIGTQHTNNLNIIYELSNI